MGSVEKFNQKLEYITWDNRQILNEMCICDENIHKFINFSVEKFNDILSKLAHDYDNIKEKLSAVQNIANWKTDAKIFVEDIKSHKYRPMVEVLDGEKLLNIIDNK